MRRILWVVALVVVTVGAGFGALIVFPQISEQGIKWTCSLDEPSKRCQERMVGMGHTWSLKGDLARATTWYELAGRQNHPAALFHLGWALEEGGIAELKNWFVSKSASADMDVSQNNSSGNSSGLPKSRFEAAEKSYRMAADQGFAPAMNNLAELYVSGMLGRSRAEEAFRLHLAAARDGNPIAAFNLSFDYLTGRGVAVDPAEAAKWASVTPQNARSDLGSLTMGRTRLHGNAVDPRIIAEIQWAAERQQPVTIKIKPMTADARLPTFRQVQDGLPASSPQ